MRGSTEMKTHNNCWKNVIEQICHSKILMTERRRAQRWKREEVMWEGGKEGGSVKVLQVLQGWKGGRGASRAF